MKFVKKYINFLVVSAMLVSSAMTASASADRYNGAIIVGTNYQNTALQESLNGRYLYPTDVEDFSSFNSNYKVSGSTDTYNPSAHIALFDHSGSGTTYEITTDPERAELGQMLFVHDVQGATGNANAIHLYRDNNGDIKNNQGFIRLKFKIKPLTNTDGVAIAGIRLWTRATNAKDASDAKLNPQPKDDDFLLHDGTIVGTEGKGTGPKGRITYNAGEWLDFEMVLDQAGNKWDVWLNGDKILEADDRPIDYTTDNENKLISIRPNKYKGTGDVGFYIDDISITKEYPMPKITALEYDDKSAVGGVIPNYAAKLSFTTDKAYTVLTADDIELKVNSDAKAVSGFSYSANKLTVNAPKGLKEDDKVTLTIKGSAKINDRTKSFANADYTDEIKILEAVKTNIDLSASFMVDDPNYSVTSVTGTVDGADINLEISSEKMAASPIAVAYIYGTDGEISSMVTKKITNTTETISLSQLPQDFSFDTYKLRLFILESKTISYSKDSIKW